MRSENDNFKIEDMDFPHTDDATVDEIRKEVAGYLCEKPASEVVVFYTKKKPLAVSEFVELSKRLTKDHNRVIVVLPASPKPEVVGWETNRYCKFKCAVTAEFTQTRTDYELFKTFWYYRSDDVSATPEEREYSRQLSVQFITERLPVRRNYDQFRSVSFSRYIYHALTEDAKKFLLLSDVKLDVGQEYVVTGFTFSTSGFNLLDINIGKKQAICFAVYAETEEAVFDFGVLQKCLGKPFEWFVKSVTYPYDNTLAEFAELVALNVFHLPTGFPFNLIFIGGADRSKTAMLSKLAAITNSPVYDTGGSTVKGLIPTFSNANIDSGILASSTCKHKALINEFFELLNKIPIQYRPSYLASLKTTLEGRITTHVSGNGQMTIRQRGDMIGASNFPSKQGGSKFRSVYELYDTYDAAVLDRILFYTVPHDQEQLVTENKDRVSQILLATGGNDPVDQLKKLPYDDMLSPSDIRALMNIGKKLRPRIADLKRKVELAKEFQKQLPAERFTRHSEFLFNIASAYAYIRCLSAGKLDESLSVEVTNEELDRAYYFLWNILHTYENLEDSITQRAQNIRLLTSAEKEVYGFLLETWRKNENPHLKKILLSDSYNLLPANMPQKEREAVIGRLAERELAITDGKYIMMFPELTNEARERWVKLNAGEAVDRMFGHHLCHLGLATKERDTYGNERFEAIWTRKGQQTVEGENRRNEVE